MARRARGEGKIYKHVSGRWAGELTIGYDGSGRRKRKTFYAATQREIQHLLAQARADFQSGLPLTSKSTTVAQLLGDWLRQGKPEWAPSTYRRYAIIVEKDLAPSLGRYPVEKLQPRQVQALLDEKRAAGASPRTVHYVRATLRAALNLAMRWGLVRRNVATLTRAPKLGRPSIRPLSPNEATEFVAVLEKDRLGPLYVVAMSCALRQSEALGLRWEDVDLRENELSIEQTIQHIDGAYLIQKPKTQASRRRIAFPEEIARVFRKQRVLQLEERVASGRDWTDHGLVFTNELGGPLYGPHVTRHLQKLTEFHGLPRIAFKELRHTGATLLLAMGVELSVIQKTLGHTSISTTTIYAHVMPELQHDAASRMGAFLRGEA